VISRAFNLHIRLAILASTVIDDSMEWRLPFEESGFIFVDFSGVDFH